MRREYFFVAVLSLVGLISLGTVVMVANAQAQNQDRAASIENQSTTWQYARLVLNDDLVAWHAGETNIVPETLTIETLYRRLGGSFRPSLTNLLNKLGGDGWELVTTDETVWTFKRRR